MACSAQFKVDQSGDRRDVSRHPPAQLWDCRSSASCWMRITTSTVQRLSFWPVSVRGRCSRWFAFSGSFPGNSPFFYQSLATALSVGLVSLGFSVWRTPRAWQDREAKPSAIAKLRPVPRRCHAEPSYSDDNPAYWLGARWRWRPLLVWAALFAGFMFGCGVAGGGRWWLDEGVHLMTLWCTFTWLQAVDCLGVVRPFPGGSAAAIARTAAGNAADSTRFLAWPSAATAVAVRLAAWPRAGHRSVHDV